MIYIIGTRHDIQHGDDSEVGNEKITEYYDYLKEVIYQKQIKILGEETSEEHINELKLSGVLGPTQSTQLTDISKEDEINLPVPIYFDPDKKESKRLSIRRRYELVREYEDKGVSTTQDIKCRINTELAPDDSRREKIWIEKLLPSLKLNKEVLLVCGYQHYDSFSRLLKENGYESEVLRVII